MQGKLDVADVRATPFLGAILIAGLLLVLGGCANPEADAALRAQSALIGMPKQTLLSCAGVPTRSTSIDNLEYYTYTADRLVSRPAPYAPGPVYGPSWNHGERYSAWGSVFDFPYNETNTYSCWTTFSLKNNAVQKLVYGGADPAGADLGQCYAIVRNCLAEAPPQTFMPGPALNSARPTPKPQ